MFYLAITNPGAGACSPFKRKAENYSAGLVLVYYCPDV